MAFIISVISFPFSLSFQSFSFLNSPQLSFSMDTCHSFSSHQTLYPTLRLSNILSLTTRLQPSLQNNHTFINFIFISTVTTNFSKLVCMLCVVKLSSQKWHFSLYNICIRLLSHLGSCHTLTAKVNKMPKNTKQVK